MTALQQAAAAQSPDSVIVKSPLPGGVAAVTRFLLTTVPQWVQLTGLVLAVIAAVVVGWWLVRHRAAIRAWVMSRSSAIKWTLGIGATVLLVSMVGFGTATWNYTQHSNDFCTSCHVMQPAYSKFASTGNKHGELSCHSCHTQTVFASAWQLYFWLKERPDEIGAHATVENRVCETCHVTGDTARWQQVRATAGHRVHLESDSSALKDLKCVTCHGVEVHRFQPAKMTCGQSGCHEESETRIVLEKMKDQTIRHCTACHVFTAEVPALATRDSARGVLVPGGAQCFGCHDMKKALPDFDPVKDPHGGKCGTCHNPHTQETTAAAAKSCTTAACHGQWQTVPFHSGATHKKVSAQCLTCHMPHQAKVDASNCAGCHADVRSRSNLRPPLPFDTTKALRRTSAAPATPTPSTPAVTTPTPHQSVDEFVPQPQSHSRPTGPSADETLSTSSTSTTMLLTSTVDAAPVDDDGNARIPAVWPPPAKADTFSHKRHARLACLSCHQTSGQSRLTFQPPRGCDICHHQAPATSRCASCHTTAELAAPQKVTMTVAVAGHAPAPRPVDFAHERHSMRKCVDCHTTPVTLAPAPAIAQCKDCHTEHHAAGRVCSTCHNVTDPKAAHATLEVAHQRCDACHTATTVAELSPTRTFCSTCHAAKATSHYDQKECSTCHFLAEPAAYRAKLIAAPR
jgi:hypothetical protein